MDRQLVPEDECEECPYEPDNDSGDYDPEEIDPEEMDEVDEQNRFAEGEDFLP